MPGIFIAIRRVLGGLVDLHEAGRFGMAGQHRVGFELPHAQGKSLVIATGKFVQILVTQEQHLVFEQCGVNFVEQVVIAHCVAQVHIEQFRADGAGQLFDSHCVSIYLVYGRAVGVTGESHALSDGGACYC
ncbi:hypothetical protein D3C73_1067890 [compost metagenome]